MSEKINNNAHTDTGDSKIESLKQVIKKRTSNLKHKLNKAEDFHLSKNLSLAIKKEKHFCDLLDAIKRKISVIHEEREKIQEKTEVKYYKKHVEEYDKCLDEMEKLGIQDRTPLKCLKRFIDLMEQKLEKENKSRA